MFIFICCKANHLLHSFIFVSNMSPWGCSGHIPPWRFLSLPSDLRLISLWSLCALATPSKPPLAHSSNLFYSWDEKEKPLTQWASWKALEMLLHFFLVFEVLASCLQRTACWRRSEMIWECKNVVQWALSFGGASHLCDNGFQWSEPHGGGGKRPWNKQSLAPGKPRCYVETCKSIIQHTIKSTF